MGMVEWLFMFLKTLLVSCVDLLDTCVSLECLMSHVAWTHLSGFKPSTNTAYVNGSGTILKTSM